MDAQRFEDVIDNELDRCRDVLLRKNAAYNAGDDKLATFKKAAAVVGPDCTQEQALWGMLSKHIVSISDMIASDAFFPPDVWDEKIGDFINYGLLLRACVYDTDDLRSDGETSEQVAYADRTVTVNLTVPGEVGGNVSDEVKNTLARLNQLINN